MLKLIAIYFLIINCCLLSGQSKGDYNWQLGFESNPQTHTRPTSLELNFGDGYLKIDTFYRAMYLGYFNTAISNSEGDLLLYTNGCQINDGNHTYIGGSKHLTPGSVDTEYCDQVSGGYPISEGGLFLSFNNDSTILLLHQRLSITGPPLSVYIDALFYSELVLDNSEYTIAQKTIPIVFDSLSYGKLEAIKSTKNESWWVIQGKRHSNSYYTILFQEGIIDTSFIQSIGDSTIQKGEATGQSVFSPDGTKYARYSPSEDLYLFDFDRETGLLSNYTKIHVADSGSLGGLAFSPNSRFLYACTKLDMYQFDTWEDNIESSKIHLGHYDGYAAPFPSTFHHMQLGPDCRIYLSSPNGTSVMHIIHSPDNKGIDCEFEQHGFHLLVNNSITQPNFPVFRVNDTQPCDPSLVTGTKSLPQINSLCNIYPNPVGKELNIQLSDDWELDNRIRISIYDISGKIIFEKTDNYRKSIYSIGLEVLNAGVYFVRIESENHSFTNRIIKL